MGLGVRGCGCGCGWVWARCAGVCLSPFEVARGLFKPGITNAITATLVADVPAYTAPNTAFGSPRGRSRLAARAKRGPTRRGLARRANSACIYPPVPQQPPAYVYCRTNSLRETCTEKSDMSQG